MTFDLRPVPLDNVRRLCEQHHGYGSAGKVSVYAFGVFEHDSLVAAFSWQPPPPGCAKQVCPEAPHAVLALSRMVAVPKAERALKHISKPLRQQMKREIDRTRWPVLVTFSDEGQGHTGHVYKCSGWTPTTRRRTSVHELEGLRVSRYADGRASGAERVGTTWIQRWEHRCCPAGEAAAWLAGHGWVRQQTGRVWRSGNPAFRWVKAN